VQNSNYIPSTTRALLSSHVGVVLKPDVIILESNATVDEATKLMKEKNSRSVLASNKGEVIGIVSKNRYTFQSDFSK
jgi:CBS domain-containing protein